MQRNDHPHRRDAAAFRELGTTAIDLAARHLETLEAMPDERVVPAGVRARLLGQDPGALELG